MALITNTAEGGVDGTAVTTGNSGGASGTAWAGVTVGTGTINFETSQFMKGALSYEFAPGSASANYVHWLPTSSNTAVFRGYIRITGNPTAGVYVVNVRNTGGGTNLMGVGISATGAVFVQDSGSVQVFTSTGTLSLNTWYRIEFSLSNGNASTGAMVLKIFTGDGTTEIANLSTTLTAQNFGTSGQGQIRIGRPTALGTMAASYWDDLAWSDGTLTLLGPSGANIPPIADAGADQDKLVSTLVTLNGTGSTDPDGTITAYLWTQTAGPTVTLTGGSTSTATFTPTVPEVYSFNLQVTDNSSATANDSVTIYVYSTTVRPISTPGPGLWTNTGGGSIHGALADESDATFAASPDNPENSSLVVLLPPMATGAVSFPLRIDQSIASPAATVLVELLDGTNSDAVVGSEQFNPSTTISAVTFQLTAAEAAAWTNRRIPKLRFTADV